MAHRTTLEKELKMKEKFQKCEHRFPSGKMCGAQFESPIDLVKHLRGVHGHPETYSPLIAAVVELKGPDFRSLDGEPVFMKLAPYQKNRFCILHVAEYKFWVRAWVTEADPSINPTAIVPVKITVPAPDVDKKAQNKKMYQYQFTGKILPFGTYSFKSDGPVEYFDIPKNFLRQFYERRDNGRFGLSIVFAIGMYDATQVFKEVEQKIGVIQINEEGHQDKDSGGKDQVEREAETVSSEATGGGAEEKEEKEDDDEIIVRPFYEVYD